MNTHCPYCPNGLLEFISGEFGSGVFAPDGAQEMLHEEFYECDRCGRKFDPDEIDELIAEGNGPDPLAWPA